MKARKRRGRTVVVILLVIALIGMFVAFAMQTASLPPPVAEIPTEPDPVEPSEPTEPTEPDNPTVPAEHKLKLVSVTQSGTVQGEVDAIDDEDGTGALILCKMPPGTEIVLDLEGNLREGYVSFPGRPHREYSLDVKTGIYEITFHGIVPTSELKEQLKATHVDSSGKKSVGIEPGTILGKVGEPLKNDWELEGCNLIIVIGIYPGYGDLFEPSVASIIEAITR